MRGMDEVIAAYKKDVDRTLLRENLKLTPQERSEKFARLMDEVFAMKHDSATPRVEPAGASR